MAVASALTPFHVDVPQSTLDDLNGRLARVRLPADLDNDDWEHGTNSAYLRELIEYWRDEFDWRAREREINELTQFRVPIRGVPIHFVHERGRGASPLPIVLTHGWPWTFWDWRKVIGPLTDPMAHGGESEDAFDVVVPSLPGFTFSTPLPRTGVSWIDTADMWVELMRDQLGYERFVAAGADWGTAITSQLGHKYPEHVAGIHVTGGHPLSIWNTRRPWDLGGEWPLGDTPEEQERGLAWQRRFASHVAVHVLDAQTLANALHDSPAGLCSWILKRRRSGSDCGGDVERRFSKDDLLTTMMLYWVTESFVNSARYYQEAARDHWTPSHDGVPEVAVPTAVTVFRPDSPGVPTEQSLWSVYNITQFRVHDHGGHFAPTEEPDAIVDDLRDAFRPLRAAMRGRAA